MTTERPTNKPSLVSRFSALSTALAADQDTQFVLAGKTYTKAAILGILAAYVDAHQATASRHQAWMTAVGEEQTALANARPIRAQLKTVLQGRLGKTSPDLARYGFDPGKVPARSVANKAVAIAKNVATRKARNTMGSQQKKGVKGDVVGVTVTPVTALKPAVTAPSSPGAPATSAGTTAATATTHTS
jgi:hypothetical protein